MLSRGDAVLQAATLPVGGASRSGCYCLSQHMSIIRRHSDDELYFSASTNSFTGKEPIEELGGLKAMVQKHRSFES